MGSFWGHIDGGAFFMGLSLWWMVNIFTEYIKNSGRTGDIKLPCSFGLPGKPSFPIEIYAKIGFPLFGFCCEFLADGFFNFIDDNGNFENLVNIQHMTIYGLFVIHGLTDLFQWYRWPVIKDANLMTLSAGFLWYGVGFIFHSTMHGKEPLESVVHLVPLPVLFGASACAAARLVCREGVSLPLTLTFCVFTLGTWFCHVPFMLYTAFPFPGRVTSGWDRGDHRNVAFAVAMFGAHACFNVIIMWVLYVITYCVMTRSGRAKTFAVPYEDETSQYQRLKSCDDVESS